MKFLVQYGEGKQAIASNNEWPRWIAFVQTLHRDGGMYLADGEVLSPAHASRAIEFVPFHRIHRIKVILEE